MNLHTKQEALAKDRLPLEPAVAPPSAPSRTPLAATRYHHDTMKIPHLLLPGFARLRAFLLAAASLHCLLVPPAHAAPGDLDATFGTGGKVITAIGSGSDGGRSVAVQSDGKIVVAGSTGDDRGDDIDFALVRYTRTGALDTSFNGTGKVTTNLGSVRDSGSSVAVQTDGKIVVAGSVVSGGNPDDWTWEFNSVLVRYTSTGALDTSFNGTGKVITHIGGNGSGSSVAVQGDGKIVVAGCYGGDFVLVRYTSTGALDTSFNGTGSVTTPIGGNNDTYRCRSVAVQSDGRIVMAGYASSFGGTALVRHTSTGALDTSFNGTGKVITPIGEYSAASVAVQSDGKIVVAGGYRGDFALVRYTSTGALDTSFNGTGKVTTDFGGSDFGSSVAVQGDGKIVVAGSSRNGILDSNIALVRYTRTGALDTSFNGTGKVTPDFGVGDHSGTSVAVQSDGRIVVAGSSYYAGGNYDFALVRYEGDLVDLDLDDDGLLDSWEIAHFGTIAGHSALDDTDHDGRVELLELAFGADPLVSDPGATPAVIIEAGYLTTTIAKQPGVTYLVGSAQTLDAAFSATSTTVLLDTATTLKVRDNVPVGTAPARFLRVKVTAAP